MSINSINKNQYRTLNINNKNIVVIKNKLEPDYEHYITNQIMKPLLQLFGLLLEQLKIFKKQKECIR